MPKGGKGLGKGGAMIRKPSYKGTLHNRKLYSKLKKLADIADEEKERKRNTIMPLTERMVTALEDMYEEATTRYDHFAYFERQVTQRVGVVLQFTHQTINPFSSLNVKTKEKAWDGVYERIREFYAPFHVEYDRSESRTEGILYGKGFMFKVHW